MTTRSAPHHIFLIPGFFGFANLGGLFYFMHVAEWLEHVFAQAGLPVTVHRVPTLPTASIEARAGRILAALRDHAGDRGLIHLVGHSTGGLDARLFTTPGFTLPDAPDLEAYVRRVRTVVTVATPHYGTPLASFFRSIFGQQMLRLLSLTTIYALRYGKLPIGVALKLGGLLARLDDHLGMTNTLIDQLYGKLLGDFTVDRREAITDFLGLVRTDQSLLTQLTPEGIATFNASTEQRPGVRYGSVVTAARPPGLVSIVETGLDPYAQATHAIYRALHHMTSRMAPGHVPLLDDTQRAAVEAALGRFPDARTNDGVVPTLSQVWGEVIHVDRADHLDVVGHFDDRRHEPPHIDWLHTGSGFRRPAFERLWTRVGDYLTGAAVPRAA